MYSLFLQLFTTRDHSGVRSRLLQTKILRRQLIFPNLQQASFVEAFHIYYLCGCPVGLLAIKDRLLYGLVLKNQPHFH